MINLVETLETTTAEFKSFISFQSLYLRLPLVFILFLCNAEKNYRLAVSNFIGLYDWSIYDWMQKQRDFFVFKGIAKFFYLKKNGDCNLSSMNLYISIATS